LTVAQHAATPDGQKQDRASPQPWLGQRLLGDDYNHTTEQHLGYSTEDVSCHVSSYSGDQRSRGGNFFFVPETSEKNKTLYSQQSGPVIPSS